MWIRYFQYDIRRLYCHLFELEIIRKFSFSYSNGVNKLRIFRYSSIIIQVFRYLNIVIRVFEYFSIVIRIFEYLNIVTRISRLRENKLRTRTMNLRTRFTLLFEYRYVTYMYNSSVYLNFTNTQVFEWLRV